MKPFKSLLIFGAVAAVSAVMSICATDGDYDDDDDDDDRPRRTSTTTTTVEERRVAPATTQETRVIRY